MITRTHLLGRFGFPRIFVALLTLLPLHWLAARKGMGGIELPATSFAGPPPMPAVVSHIDKLRPFTEWSPPYDLTDPANPKAANIAAAVDVIARDLDFPPDLTILVCLAPDRLYNVEDTLAAVILEQSGEGWKTQYLRCLEVRKKKGPGRSLSCRCGMRGG